MARKDYVPKRESVLVTFSTNFNDKIRTGFAAYGLTSAQATAYDAKHDAFLTAYQTANNPDTRSPSNIVAKNMAKDALITELRRLAAIVQAYPAITPELLSELGLTIRDAEPSPIPAPTQAPGLDVLSAVGRTVKVRLHDAAAPANRGKPDGVAGASIFSFVGESAPADLAQWEFEGNFTRTTVDVEFPTTVANGATVWFTARWFNPRMEMGPVSTPVSTNLPGGLAMAA